MATTLQRRQLGQPQGVKGIVSQPRVEFVDRPLHGRVECRPGTRAGVTRPPVTSVPSEARTSSPTKPIPAGQGGAARHSRAGRAPVVQPTAATLACAEPRRANGRIMNRHAGVRRLGNTGPYLLAKRARLWRADSVTAVVSPGGVRLAVGRAVRRTRYESPWAQSPAQVLPPAGGRTCARSMFF